MCSGGGHTPSVDFHRLLCLHYQRGFSSERAISIRPDALRDLDEVALLVARDVKFGAVHGHRRAYDFAVDDERLVDCARVEVRKCPNNLRARKSARVCVRVCARACVRVSGWVRVHTCVQA